MQTDIYTHSNVYICRYTVVTLMLFLTSWIQSTSYCELGVMMHFKMCVWFCCATYGEE